MVINMNDESCLELLIDSCRKTIATGCGNGHHEYVLYKNKETGEYELHYYDLQVGAKEESHGYKIVDEDVYLSLMKQIEENNLDERKDIHGFGLCGGDYICKYKKNEEYIRITTANFNGEEFKPLINIYKAMAAYYSNSTREN